LAKMMTYQPLATGEEITIFPAFVALRQNVLAAISGPVPVWCHIGPPGPGLVPPWRVLA
jgi:hypothetical protein